MIEINQFTILGRLVREPALHTGKSGACARFTVAVNRRWTDKSGNPQTEVAFLDCKAFNGWTERLAGRTKGTPVLATGRLRTESWEQDQTSRTQLTLVCETVQVLEFPDRESPKTGEVMNNAKAVPF